MYFDISTKPLVKLAFGLFLLALAGCSGVSHLTDESPDLDQYVVAKFGQNYRITAADLNERIFHSALVPAGGIVPDTLIDLFLDSILIDTIAGLEANNFNLDSVWLQARAHQDENQAFLIRDWWDYSVFDHVKADSTEVYQFWQDHPDEFFIPEQINAYHILCSPDGFLHGPDSLIALPLSREERMDLAEELCRNLHQMLEYGEPFQNVAYVYSHDVLTRQKGGHLGWVVRETYFDPFDSIAFGMDVYDYSDPYKDADGWHIVYKEGHLGPGPVPFDSAGVYDAAEQALMALKANRASARVADSLVHNLGYHIVYNEKYMNTNINKLPDSLWAATVNDMDTIDMRALKPLERPYTEKYYVDSTFDDIRREMIHEAADRLMLVQAARAAGLDKKPKYVEDEHRRRHTKSKSLILAKRFGSSDWIPTRDSMRAYYDSHIDAFVPSHHLDIEQLTIRDSALAAFLREQAEVGHELRDLGEYWSKDMEMDVRYDDLGIIDSGTVPDPVFNAAKVTRRHGVSLLYKTDQGFHFLRVKSRKEEIPFENAEMLIRDKLVQLHRREHWLNFRDSLYQSYGVEKPHQLYQVKVPRRAERI